MKNIPLIALFLSGMLSLSLFPLSSNANEPAAARIQINISGAPKDGRYFLCLPDVGCFNIKLLGQGKTLPIYRPINIRALFINDVASLHLYRLPMPASCATDVGLNQTITISGKLTGGQHTPLQLQQFHCSVQGSRQAT